MKLSVSLKQLALAAAMGAVSAGAMAATDGTVGSTSTGDFEIYYNQNADVRIWGLEDVVFDRETSDKSFTFCTYSNNTTKIQFTLSSRSGNFSLDSGSTIDSPGGTTAQSIPYAIRLQDSGLPESDGDASWGVGGLGDGERSPARFQSQGEQSDVACAGAVETTDLTVSIPSLPANLSDGAYSDVVTLTIRPI